ncbi:MAG: immune inhibitor A, partial [Anaerolineae bacterium]
FEERFTPDTEAVKRSAENFENVIYPTVRRYFGDEQSPGVDGDVHLYIVHAYDLGQSVAGYYMGDSELPIEVSPTSNEHQMFFINLDAMAGDIGTDYYDSVLAHEFEHMIRANIDRNEPGWVDEGMAELAASLATPEGFGIGFVPDFMRLPGTQLNNWNEIEDASPNYGGSYLFAAYFLQRFGENALRLLTDNQLDGFEAFTDTLRQLNALDPVTGKIMTSDELFADWIVANLLNDPTIDGPRFGYTNIKATLPKPRIAKMVLDKPAKLKLSQFGTTYFTLDDLGQYTLTVKGTPTVKVIPADAENGHMFWWSNRGEEMDTRLTHEFDLTSVSTATLQFRTWFDIEDGWDFGYVVVSIDGGKTWTTLQLPAGTEGAEENNFYGSGYTGQSSGWIDQQIDLSTYAGEKILLRFEYISDAAINNPGFAIDDIRIPEIGYFSDAETDDGGWLAEGWVRMDNILPQYYLIQKLTAGKTTTVERLLTAEDGVSGSWEFEIGGDVSSVSFTLSGLTEFTTEAASLTYSVETR